MKILLEKTKQLCTKSQYGEATWWETMQLKFFILFSKECADFSEKNTKLSSLVEDAELFSLSQEDKANLKEQLKNKSE